MTASAPFGIWQPIATAPKDGTQILAWRDNRVHLMRWNAQCQFWDEWHVGIEPLRRHQPTAWMPLPAPPSTDEKEEDHARHGKTI